MTEEQRRQAADQRCADLANTMPDSAGCWSAGYFIDRCIASSGEKAFLNAILELDELARLVLKVDVEGLDTYKLTNLARKHILPEPVADEPVALDICPNCDGSGVGVADTTCGRCNGLGGVPPAPDQAQPIDDEALVERAAWSIIDGSAGERAANHAREFCTANWSDALRSARAILPIIREHLK